MFIYLRSKERARSTSHANVYVNTNVITIVIVAHAQNSMVETSAIYMVLAGRCWSISYIHYTRIIHTLLVLTFWYSNHLQSGQDCP